MSYNYGETELKKQTRKNRFDCRPLFLLWMIVHLVWVIVYVF